MSDCWAASWRSECFTSNSRFFNSFSQVFRVFSLIPESLFFFLLVIFGCFGIVPEDGCGDETVSEQATLVVVRVEDVVSGVIGAEADGSIGRLVTVNVESGKLARLSVLAMVFSGLTDVVEVAVVEWTRSVDLGNAGVRVLHGWVWLLDRALDGEAVTAADWL